MCTARRNGFVLIAVLVIVGSAVLVATGVLFIAQGRAAEVAGSSDAVQSRALAWSGLQAVMARLADQRDRILAGQTPEVDRQYTIYEAGSHAGVIRVLPISSQSDVLLSAEAGKLDLNTVSAELLVRTGMIDAATAAAIIAQRDRTADRGFQSVGELLSLTAAPIAPAKLYGEIAEIKPRDQAQQVQGDLAQRVAARLQPQRVRGLCDVLTVFSVEPNVQKDGKPRINLNVPWSEELATQVRTRLGQSAVNLIREAVAKGAALDSEASLVKLLASAELPVQDWPEFLDALTVQADELRLGRLDINTAPAEALASLPGLTSEQASQIADLRQHIADDERGTIAWPVIAQIVSAENLQQIADRITTRCWSYSIRLAAGEVDADHPNGPLSNPIIWEAVVDLSSSSPRLAYLRDISVLQAASQIALDATANQVGGPDETNEDSPEQQAAARTPPDDSVLQSPATEPAEPARGTGKRIGRWIGGGG